VPLSPDIGLIVILLTTTVVAIIILFLAKSIRDAYLRHFRKRRRSDSKRHTKQQAKIIDKAKALRQNGKINDSIRLLEANGLLREAVYVAENAGMLREAANLLMRAKKPHRAAAIFAKHKQWEDAARCFQIAGRTEDAGKCLLEGGRFEEAAFVFRSAGNMEKAAFCNERCGNYHMAAKQYLDARQPDRAVSIFARLKRQYRDRVLLLDKREIQCVSDALKSLQLDDDLWQILQENGGDEDLFINSTRLQNFILLDFIMKRMDSERMRSVLAKNLFTNKENELLKRSLRASGNKELLPVLSKTAKGSIDDVEKTVILPVTPHPVASAVVAPVAGRFDVLLSQCALFSKLPQDSMSRLFALGQTLSLSMNEAIHLGGGLDGESQLAVILSGAIEKHEPISDRGFNIVRLGAGTVLGSETYFLEQSETSKSLALEPVVMWTVPIGLFQKYLETEPTSAQKIYKNFVHSKLAGEVTPQNDRKKAA
jgi:tetratricopeptide (TPR) repeat protein